MPYVQARAQGALAALQGRFGRFDRGRLEKPDQLRGAQHVDPWVPLLICGDRGCHHDLPFRPEPHLEIHLTHLRKALRSVYREGVEESKSGRSDERPDDRGTEAPQRSWDATLGWRL